MARISRQRRTNRAVGTGIFIKISGHKAGRRRR